MTVDICRDKEKIYCTLIDSVVVFMSHSTQNSSFRRRSPSQSPGLVWKN